MNILSLVTDAFGGYGGIAQYNQDFIGALASLNGAGAIHVLSRLAPDPPSDLPDHTRQYPAVRNKFAYSLAAVGLAAKIRPDIVFCGHLYHGPLAARVARLHGARLISQLHGTEIWPPLKPAHLAPLVRSDLVLCVSADTRDRYLTKGGNESDNAAVVHNTVGDQFQPGDREAARARFGLGDATAILTVARIDKVDRYKGHDRIIDALAGLRAGGRDVVYLIAGVGDDQPRLEDRARSHGVSEHVRFLGKVPHDALPDLYRAADLFAMPSTGEGFGIAFIEAMACGTPAIGLAVAGAVDALAEGELGWCVSETDFPGALTQALAADRPDPARLHAAVQDRFGAQAFRARLGHALGALLQRGAAAP